VNPWQSHLPGHRIVELHNTDVLIISYVIYLFTEVPVNDNLQLLGQYFESTRMDLFYGLLCLQ